MWYPGEVSGTVGMGNHVLGPDIPGWAIDRCPDACHDLEKLAQTSVAVMASA
jgi:hypothetical protein